MINIKQKVHNLRKEIAEIDNLKKLKLLEIKELYAMCKHDFELIYKGYEDDIYICKICGYEDWKKRSM